MKLVAIAVSLGLAAPAFACPNMDHDQATPKTAEKKEQPKSAPKAKEQPKQDAPKQDQQKPATDTAKKDKKGDKVSLK